MGVDRLSPSWVAVDRPRVSYQSSKQHSAKPDVMPYRRLCLGSFRVLRRRHKAATLALARRMKVLFINPNREQVPWPAIPVGMCTVATATARAGHDVSVLDLAFSKQPGQQRADRQQSRPAQALGQNEVPARFFSHGAIKLNLPCSRKSAKESIMDAL